MSSLRERHRQGTVRLVGGVPHPDRATTLSLLAVAPIGQWLADHSHLVTGRLLDVGCGNRPYAPWYTPLAESCVGLDATPGDGVAVLGLADHLPFADATFDTVLCTEVLEHVGDAERAASELCRVTRPGGHVLVTVPYLYPTHEAPYDFRRFTHFGLRDLLTRHGLEVISVQARGAAGLLLVHFGVLAVVAALEALSSRLGRPLLSNRALRAAVAAPQEALLRGRPVSRDLRGTATKASLGYLAVARRPRAATTP